MKRLLLSLLLLCSACFGTTTVTGTLSTLGTGTTSGFVRFWLRGCNGNQPRITGTGAIAPTQGAVWYVDLTANSSGAISGTIYSTRDNTGTGNGDIECGGSYTAVWYGVQIWQNGKAGPEMPVHAKSGATLDISNVTLITSNPVVTAPTGDTTYARIDGGNTPFTGPVSVPKLNNVPYADTASGADMCARIDTIAQTGATYINAEGFIGTQTCTSGVNPFAHFASGTVLKLGAVTWQIPTQIKIVAGSQNITIEGPSKAVARIVYTGVGALSRFFAVNDDAPVSTLWNFTLKNVAIYSSNSAGTVTAALDIRLTHHVTLDHVYLWGATKGLYTAGSIGANRFYFVNVSVDDANNMGLTGPVPVKGIELDIYSSAQTTQTTIDSSSIEGLTGCGINVLSAAQVTILNTTSERHTTASGKGVCVQNASQLTTLIDDDLEQNSSNVDLEDHGLGTKLYNITAGSNGGLNSIVVASDSRYFFSDTFYLPSINASATNAGYCYQGGCYVPLPRAIGTWGVQSTGNGSSGLPTPGTTGPAVGMTTNASGGGGNTEISLYNQTIGGWTVSFMKNTGSGYVTTGWLDGSGMWNALAATGGFSGPFHNVTSILKINNVPLIYNNNPTVTGFGTSPSIVVNNGTAAMQINVGTGGTATSGVINFPTAANNGWACHFDDVTTQSTTVFVTKQIAGTNSTATIANYNTAGAQAAWVASDKLNGNCSAF